MKTPAFEATSLDKLISRVRNPVIVEEGVSYKEIGIRSHGKGLFYKAEVSHLEIGNKSVFWIEPDCFILNIVFAWEGAVARTTSADVGLIASHRFPMYRANSALVDLDYLVYFFNTPLGKHFLGLASPGGAGRNKTLGQKEFLELKIPLPPIEYQRKAVRLLSCLDRQISQLDGLSLNHKLFLSELTDRLVHAKFDGLTWKHSDTSVGDLVNFTGGSQPPRSTFKFSPSDDYIRMLQIRDYKSDKRATYIPKDLATRSCKENDVMIGRYGPPIFQILRGKKGAYNVALIKAEPKSEISKEYLYYFLKNKTLFKLIESYSKRSAGQSGIDMTALREFSMPVPTKATEKSIVNVLGALSKASNAYEKLRELTLLQKHGLLNRLLIPNSENGTEQ